MVSSHSVCAGTSRSAIGKIYRYGSVFYRSFLQTNCHFHHVTSEILIETVSCWLTVLLNWFLAYYVVAASRGASNSQNDSLVVLSQVEQASEPICLECRVVVECSPLATRSYSP